MQDQSSSGRVSPAYWIALGLAVLVGAALRTWALADESVGVAMYPASARNVFLSVEHFLMPSPWADGSMGLDKPPGYIWILSLGIVVLGAGALGTRLPSVFAALASVPLVAAIVRRGYGPVAAVGAGVLLAVHPGSVNFSRASYHEPTLGLVALACVAAIVRAAPDRSLRWAAIAGALCGFGFLVKLWQSLVPLPGILLWTFVERGWSWRERGRLAGSFVAGFAVVFGTWAALASWLAGDRPIMNADGIADMIFGWNLRDRFSDNFFVDGRTPQYLWAFEPPTASMFGVCFALALPGAIAAGARAIKHREGQAAMWLGWFALGLLSLSRTRLQWPQYLEVLTPPTAVLFGLGLAQLWSRDTTPRLRAGLLLAVVVAGGYASVIAREANGWTGDLLPAIAVASVVAVAALARVAHVVTRPDAAARRRGLDVLLLGALVLVPLNVSMRNLAHPPPGKFHAVGADRMLDEEGESKRSPRRKAAGASVLAMAGMSPEEHHALAAELAALAGGRPLACESLNIAAHFGFEDVPAIAIYNEYRGVGMLDDDALAAKIHSGELEVFVLEKSADVLMGSTWTLIEASTRDVTDELSGPVPKELRVRITPSVAR